MSSNVNIVATNLSSAWKVLLVLARGRAGSSRRSLALELGLGSRLVVGPFHGRGVYIVDSGRSFDISQCIVQSQVEAWP